VQWADFERALSEVQPRLGAKTDELERLFRNGIVPYGASFDYCISTMRRLIEQVGKRQKKYKSRNKATATGRPCRPTRQRGSSLPSERTSIPCGRCQHMTATEL
jgi:hypothetical protein